MKRPPKPEAERNVFLVQTLVDESLFDWIKRSAEAVSMTRSRFVRMILDIERRRWRASTSAERRYLAKRAAVDVRSVDPRRKT